MAKVCVEIEIDDQTGDVSVGLEPPGGEDQGAGGDMGNMGDTTQGPSQGMSPAEPVAEENNEKPWLKPVGSIDEALQVAADLLKNAGAVAESNTRGEIAKQVWPSKPPMKKGMM